MFVPYSRSDTVEKINNLERVKSKKAREYVKKSIEEAEVERVRNMKVVQGMVLY